ncbi:MAG: ABC transporter substrate-binding protein [Candidatus Kariarchaeaceae archaeon]
MSKQLKHIAIISILLLVGSTVNQTIAQEIPDPVFSFIYLSPTGNSAREAYSLLLVETFPKAGIGITKHEITDFTSMSQRAWAWDGGYPIPLFDDGGFDALSVGLSGAIDYDPTSTFHTRSHIPTGLNMYDFGNAASDSLIEAYTTSLDFDTRDAAAKEFQTMLLEELPTLTIYYTVNLHVVSESMNWGAIDALWKTNGADGLRWANITGGDDNEFSWGHPYGINELDPITVTQYMTNRVMDPMFPGLYNRDPVDNLFKPALAVEPILWDGLEATVKLRSDVTFSNGAVMNAYDVKNSWDWALTDITGTNIKGDLVPYISSTDSIIVIDDQTVKFVFDQPYFTPESLLNTVPIMPDEVIGPVTVPIITDYDFTPCALTCVVGTGPFMYDAIDTIAREIKLKAVPNWWGGEIAADTVYFPFYATKDAALVAIKAGDVDYIDNNYVVQIAEVAGAAGVEGIEGVMSGGVQMVALNLNHPVFGTGVDTPLGKQDPTRAAEAARYVRHAMNHMIPREQIVTDILKGLGVAAVSNWPMLSPHFDTTQTVAEFSIEMAQEYLTMAGYGEYYTPITTTSSSEGGESSRKTTSSSDSSASPTIDLPLSTLSVYLGLSFVSLVYIKKFKK